MQPSHIKLKEIIWEVTDNCHNGCKYCGSKDILNKTPIDHDIITIAHKIADYPPEEVNISGGDPLELGLDLTREVFSILKYADCNVKVIVNPKSLLNIKDANHMLEVYDWVGLSINTAEELEYAVKWLDGTGLVKRNVTVITNFGVHNVFNYEQIERFVVGNHFAWQVQYTQCDDGIYKNPQALKYLHNKMNKSLKNGVKLIPADDMNNGPCGAGMMSCGILANGDVLPCLSMRCWSDSLMVQGNLIESELKSIWENRFKTQRFGQFECCKDVCNAPFNPEPVVVNQTVGPNQTVKYGVQTPDPLAGQMLYAVQAYAVQQPTYSLDWLDGSVYRYGVFSDKV